MYFHFLFSVKRLDLFLLYLVTLPELADQSQFHEYSPEKERNDGFDIRLYLLTIFPQTRRH